MDKVNLSSKLVIIKKTVDELINDLTRTGCICENGLDYGSSGCSGTERHWSCFRCGASRKIIDCHCNHINYDCPFCGEHLT